MEKRCSFELFKSNVCHRLKEQGDIDFLIMILRNGRAVQVIQIGEKWVEIKSQGKLGYIHREDFDENFSEISLNIG